MKKIILTLFCSCMLLPLAGKELSQPMTNYRDGCLKMGLGFVNLDKYLMYEAIDLFNSVKLSNFDDVVPVDGSTAQLEKQPIFFFISEFADSLLLYDFDLVRVDPPTIMFKGDGTNIYLFHRTIPAGATLSYKARAGGECEMIAVTLPNLELGLTVTDLTSGKSYVGNMDGCMAWVIWDMSEAGDFLFTIKNEGDHDAPFVVAMN